MFIFLNVIKIIYKIILSTLKTILYNNDLLKNNKFNKRFSPAFAPDLFICFSVKRWLIMWLHYQKRKERTSFLETVVYAQKRFLVRHICVFLHKIIVTRIEDKIDYPQDIAVKNFLIFRNILVPRSENLQI